jgi:hypothetical protein
MLVSSTLPGKINEYTYILDISKQSVTSVKVWLQLAQWFLRRRLKCEMLTDGRWTKSDGKKHKNDEYKQWTTKKTNNQAGRHAKNRKRGDEIVIVHCCFSISQNELKF